MEINWHEALDLYFIAGSQDVREGELSTLLQEAIDEGITCFQFREKGSGALKKNNEIYELGLICREICHNHNIPFIVNDDVTLALRLKADGVHVGQADESIRSVLNKVEKAGIAVGLSVNNLAQLQAAQEIDEIAYLGVGPVFLTQSKVDAQPVLGLEKLTKMMKGNKRKPIVAIGGINVSNSQKVREAGIDGIAVISAITQSQQLTRDIEKLKGRGAK